MNTAPSEPEFSQRLAQRSAQAAALDQLGIRASMLGTPGAVALAVIVAQLQSVVAKLQAAREASPWQRLKRGVRALLKVNG